MSAQSEGNYAEALQNYYEKENIDLVMVQQVVECESTRYVNLEVGDRSNNLEIEFEVENTSPVASPHGTQVNISNDNLEATLTPISYHIPPTQQFLNMDEAINCVVSDWTPWKTQMLMGSYQLAKYFPQNQIFNML